MTSELFAVRGQAGTATIAHKQATTQLAFQVVDARGDGGLGDMKALRGRHEAARANDLEKSTSQFNIHVSYQYH
ncbi:hypothetical protein B27N_00396 [Alcanivorax marinus]|nr:hypothetical protein [Alloalcanivorax marinus]